MSSTDGLVDDCLVTQERTLDTASICYCGNGLCEDTCHSLIPTKLAKLNTFERVSKPDDGWCQIRVLLHRG